MFSACVCVLVFVILQNEDPVTPQHYKYSSHLQVEFIFVGAT